MLKAVKESLKNWLVTHERLYWYIVVGLAVLGFGIVTALGCAKLEQANAAEEMVKVAWKGEEVSVPLGNYPYYLVLKGAGGYGDVLFLSMYELEYENRSGTVYFCYYDDVGNQTTAKGTCRIYGNKVSGASSLSDTAEDSYGLSFNRTFSVEQVVSNYDVLNSQTGEVVYSANPFPPAHAYSPDAPYVKFEGVSWSNLYLDGKPLLFHIGTTFDNKTKYSGWGYSGKLSNFDSTGATSYSLNVDYVVELPTWEYVKELCEIKGVPYYGWDTSDSSQMLRSIWDSNEDIPKHVYRFTYPVTLEDGINFDSSDGSFYFSLSFEEIEVLIRYFNDTAFQQLMNDIAYEDEAEELRAHYLSYLHIDEVRIVVHADMVDSSIYGPMTVNVFQRSMKSAPLVKVVDVDYLAELEGSLDDVVNESVMSGFEEYYKSLEEKIDGLESQLQDIYLVEDGFGGDLESTDLWVSFRSLAEGLAGMAPAVGAIASLSGAVLSFLPLQITGIMSFTLLAICIIAIIKAIRG